MVKLVGLNLLLIMLIWFVWLCISLCFAFVCDLLTVYLCCWLWWGGCLGVTLVLVFWVVY